ncbi:T9SS-dependent M36 family metallopeptidase [Chryseobacterium sp. GMJ5]|uniref:T9SS-dependent M36 family metallopeptidase n=1 Tax=Chryseobacterium gilvum TaxID=2976534 RepID=A0ABT2VTF7_9FLAO|nr:T9SS-dependent M36 family metallopeptidase [Chryseobacterium gilvum]MCU7613284.1 T9SS-dependent M36 family metallopeptidase [Chryseobacterium gilvum]
MKKITLPLLFAVFTIFPSSKIFSQEKQTLIKDYISTNHLREYKKSDLMNFIIDNVDVSASLKGDVVKFQQTYNGLPIHNAVGTALVRDGKIIYYNDNFLKNYSNASSSSASVNKNAAFDKIIADLNNNDLRYYPILNSSEAEPANINVAKQKLIYVEDQSDLKLAYQFTFQEPKSPNYWEILVDAHTGQIIDKINLNLSCNFHHDAYSHDDLHIAENHFIGPVNKTSNQAASFLAPDNASYNVFPLPLEAPTFGSRSIVTNPWMVASSPEGWHYDGTTRYTYTRGNNVYAYEDVNASNTVGLVAEGGTARNFNFPFDLYADPFNNQNAAITNLFYINNKVHDIFYKFGFTESARNFQQTNFGLGGAGNDYVNAESQDGGGTDNANFATPADGSKPRMQMYLWSSVNRVFYYNSPSQAVPRQPVPGLAQFGNPLDATGVTGNVQLSSVLDGCSAIPAGSLTGKIGLIERGTCDFVTKVKNAQNAGATAAIIYNAPTSGAVGGMSGTDASITIPSVLINNSEGEFIKSQLAANTTVNVTLKNDPALTITPDGSFDNGVVIHEYGHGISNRLTGNGSTCLVSSQSKEQMGEGWSDFFALMLTNRPGDNASVPRGMATYAAGQSYTGSGIRPGKYSPDFTINGFTYGNTNGLEYTNQSGQIVPDVHSIGFIWASTLWDLNWEYVAKYGYSSDVTANTTNGSSRVLQLVTNALKLQVCNPTFIDGRNAILSAELAATGGTDRCMIWRTFAKRGLGVNASAGVKTNINDQVQDFSVPSDCVLATEEVISVKDQTISIYPNPAKNEFFINFPKNTLGKVNVEIYDMSGKLISTENKFSPDSKNPISTDRLVNGVYLVKVSGLGINSTSKLMIKK